MEPLWHNTACIFFEPNCLDLQAAQTIAKTPKPKNKHHFETCHMIPFPPRAKFNFPSAPGCLLQAVCCVGWAGGEVSGRGLAWEQQVQWAECAPNCRWCPWVSQNSSMGDGGSSLSKGTELTKNRCLKHWPEVTPCRC